MKTTTTTKNPFVLGFREFLIKDTKETSNKSTSMPHVLCRSGVGLPDKIQDAQLYLNIK